MSMKKLSVFAILLVMISSPAFGMIRGTMNLAARVATSNYTLPVLIVASQAASAGSQKTKNAYKTVAKTVGYDDTVIINNYLLRAALLSGAYSLDMMHDRMAGLNTLGLGILLAEYANTGYMIKNNNHAKTLLAKIPESLKGGYIEFAAPFIAGMLAHKGFEKTQQVLVRIARKLNNAALMASER